MRERNFRKSRTAIVLWAAGLLWAWPAASLAEEPSSVFASKCASCHGKDAKGNPGMAKAFGVDRSALDLTDEGTLSRKDEELAALTSKGKGKMPGFGTRVSAEEISGLVAHLRVMAGGKAPEAAKEDSPKGEKAADAAKLYGSKCASCHGKDAKGSPAMAKVFKLDGAALDLLDEASLGKSDEELSRLTTEGSGKMPAFKDKLKEGEIAALTAYLRSLASPGKDEPAPPGKAIEKEKAE